MLIQKWLQLKNRQVIEKKKHYKMGNKIIIKRAQQLKRKRQESKEGININSTNDKKTQKRKNI